MEHPSIPSQSLKLLRGWPVDLILIPRHFGIAFRFIESNDSDDSVDHTSWAQLLWRWPVFLHDLLISLRGPTPTRPTDTTVGWWVLAACLLWKNLPDTNWNSWVFGCESQSPTSWSFFLVFGYNNNTGTQLYDLLYMYPYGWGLWVVAWVWLGYATYIAPSWIPRDVGTTHVTIFSPRRGDVSPPPGAIFLSFSGHGSKMRQNHGQMSQKPWIAMVFRMVPIQNPEEKVCKSWLVDGKTPPVIWHFFRKKKVLTHPQVVFWMLLAGCGFLVMEIISFP